MPPAHGAKSAIAAMPTVSILPMTRQNAGFVRYAESGCVVEGICVHRPGTSRPARARVNEAASAGGAAGLKL